MARCVVASVTNIFPAMPSPQWYGTHLKDLRRKPKCSQLKFTEMLVVDMGTFEGDDPFTYLLSEAVVPAGDSFDARTILGNSKPFQSTCWFV